MCYILCRDYYNLHVICNTFILSKGKNYMMEYKQHESENMARRNDTTVAIAGERKERLNNAVVKLVMERKESVKLSEIVHFLIDEYLEEALKDMLAREKVINKKTC